MSGREAGYRRRISSPSRGPPSTISAGAPTAAASAACEGSATTTSARPASTSSIRRSRRSSDQPGRTPRIAAVAGNWGRTKRTSARCSGAAASGLASLHPSEYADSRSSPTTVRRMQIVVITPEYPPSDRMGGIGTHSAALAPALARRGHEVCVVTRGTPGVEERDGVRIERLDHRWLPERSAEHLLALRTIAAAARRFRADVVQAAEWEAEAWWLA